MIHEYPEYYTEFSCIGGSCKDSCCIGWELDIDDESYDYYKSVQGEFGDRLRASMDENDENTFVLKDNGRCPFLNDNNLCDIYINLGEESLCNICTEYPRNHEIIGNYKQSDIGLSCLECARIHFGLDHPVRYIIRKDNISAAEVLDREDNKKLKTILLIRDSFIRIIQDNTEKYDWRNKAAIIIKLAEDLQPLWNDREYRRIKNVCHKACHHSGKKEYAEGILCNEYNMSPRMAILESINSLELLRDDLNIIINRYVQSFNGEKWKKFTVETGKYYNLWHEQLLTYYIYRYIIRAFYDNNIITKVTMAVYSAMIIQCMDYVRWCDNGQVFTLEDRIDIAHIYAKEIEHSDENLEILEEEFIFGEEYKREQLIRLL